MTKVTLKLNIDKIVFKFLPVKQKKITKQNKTEKKTKPKTTKQNKAKNKAK